LLLAAEFGTGQVFWSLLWFFLLVMLIMLCVYVVTDIVRSADLSGLSKAIWAAVVVFVPYLGVFAYIMVHGPKMGERQRQGRTHDGPLDPVAQARLMK
jgi:hypothetical protein